MKLIIDIPERYYEFCRECVINRTDTVDQQFIANGTPYKERLKGEWIPVSERLPEKSDKYWCTFNGTNLTGIDYYTTESDAKKLFDEPEECIGWQSQNVIAWQPLPEPYKEADYEVD